MTYSLHSAAKEDLRAALGFPYSLIYRQGDKGSIHVLVVRHHHRHPDFGQFRR